MSVCRPVSVTSRVGKHLEQILLKVISKNLKEKKVIGNSQYGTYKDKSCLTNLIDSMMR